MSEENLDNVRTMTASNNAVLNRLNLPAIVHLPLKLGFSGDNQVVGAHEYDRRYGTNYSMLIHQRHVPPTNLLAVSSCTCISKEKAGFIAGKHIQKQSKWWFQSSRSYWYGDKEK